MSQDELEARVSALIADHLDMDPSAVDLDSAVEEVANSLELSTLMFELEKAFETTFPDSAIGSLRILRDLVGLVRDATS